MTERRIQQIQNGHANNLLPYVFGIEDLFNIPQTFKPQSATYPPHNIVQDGDNYRVEVAVAGFRREELSVKKEKRTLSIEGSIKRDASATEVYRHKGISTKSFDLQFTLAEHVVIDNVAFEDGILTVNMHKVIPEEDKPVTYNIGYTKSE